MNAAMALVYISYFAKNGFEPVYSSRDTGQSDDLYWREKDEDVFRSEIYLFGAHVAFAILKLHMEWTDQILVTLAPIFGLVFNQLILDYFMKRVYNSPYDRDDAQITHAQKMRGHQLYLMEIGLFFSVGFASAFFSILKFVKNKRV